MPDIMNGGPENGTEPKERGRSRRQSAEEMKTKKKIPLIAVGGVFAAVAAVAGIGIFLFMRETSKYESAFLPNTTINGVDASGKTAEQMKEEIEAGLKNYSLTIFGRNGGEETITGEEIGLHSEFDGSLEAMIDAQEPGDWYKYLETGATEQIETMIVYDEELFEKRVAGLSFLDKEQMTEPVNARISEYDSGSKSYSIIPEEPGTEVLEEQVVTAVSNAVMNLQAELDLEEAGCYTKPAVGSDDEGLQNAVAQLNQYVGASVTHTFGDKKEVLNGDTISQWITVDGTNVVLDESQAAAYVKELASKYNTAYKAKKLKTTYGPTVTIEKGHYGWRINQEKEAAAVLEVVKAGEQQTREPEYSQKAASHGENDYGDTYVEINLTAQHLYFYKEGKLLTECDFVSGNTSKGWGTPSGAYPLTYKERNATLKGENYRTPVSYWMPFNGNIGMHDANWRSSFGGTLYKNGGSHGCINMPPSVAKIVFENISAGMPVLCYFLEGTETTVTTNTSGAKIQPTTAAPTTAAPETTAPPETTTPETPASPETTAPNGPVNEETKAPETEAPAGGPGGPGDSSVTETIPVGDQSGPGGPGDPAGPGGSGEPAGPGGSGDPAGPGGPGGSDTPPEGDGGNQPIGPGY